MATHNSIPYRCEALTERGGRCRMRAIVYRRYHGKEYLSCKRHDTQWFRPCRREG